MSELTKEYFDQKMGRIDKQVGGLQSEIGGLRSDMDKRFDRVEKKIEKEVHALARMTANGFADLQKQLDVREKVTDLDKRMKKIESALNISA